MDKLDGQLDFSLWLIRLIAYIIDSIIICCSNMHNRHHNCGNSGSISSHRRLFLFLRWHLAYFSDYFGLLSILYFIILDVFWGATIGKRVMGLQVQTVKGGKVPFGKSFIRNISKIFRLFLFLDWLIAIVTAGPDKRQKLTDRWAGTTVVQAGKAPIVLNERHLLHLHRRHHRQLQAKKNKIPFFLF